MEISERALRRMAREVDDQHRTGMEDFDVRVAELVHGEGRLVAGPSRRRFLQGLGLGGATLALGTGLVPIRGLVSPAHAQEGDAGVAAFAQSVELAAVAAYGLAAPVLTTPAVVDAATLFSAHHQEHADAFGAAAGDAASGEANAALIEALGPEIEGITDETSALEFAFTLEQAAAATYLFAMGVLTSEAALKLTASILPIEAQHAVVIGTVLGKGADEYLPPFETETAALSPGDFPVG
jgi:hypothetical protein